MTHLVAGTGVQSQIFILTAAVDVAFWLGAASDTALRLSVAGIAYTADRQSVAAVRVSCSVVGG